MPRRPWPPLPVCQPGHGPEQAGRAGHDRPQFTFPQHFGKNFDALYDCMTDPLHKSGPQPGFIVVLEHIPANGKFDKEAREQLLDIFRDTATSGRTARYRSAVSILFCSPFRATQPSGTGERGPGRTGAATGCDPGRREDADGQAGRRVASGAAHEQPVQRGLLARGGLSNTAWRAPGARKKAPHLRGFFYAGTPAAAAPRTRPPALPRPGAAHRRRRKALLLQPLAQRVAQDLAALAEGDLHHLGQQLLVHRGGCGMRHHAHHRAVHPRRRIEGFGGTNSTSSIA
jgi:RNAse (barnase) inhibitor barstar